MTVVSVSINHEHLKATDTGGGGERGYRNHCALQGEVQVSKLFIINQCSSVTVLLTE